MRIAVIGTGGVGGYFGAKLAQAGEDVTFVARGRHLDAIRQKGLAIESGGAMARVSPAQATDDIGSIQPVDVAMFCVKLWDVEAAAESLPKLLGAKGVVVPFQNGVEAPDLLAARVGHARVLGGVAYIAATIKSPGVIAHTGTMAKLRIGAFDAPQAQKAEAIVTACKKAGIDCERAPDIQRALWEKFVFLAAMSGATSVARQPVGVIRGDRDLRATIEQAMREVVALARRRGVNLADDFVTRQLGMLDQLPAEMRSSMLNDLLAGNRLEAPWLCGAVARMSGASGLAAPVNATLYAALKPYVDGKKQPAAA
jgi:2-dehydropantoate 2-reductase